MQEQVCIWHVPLEHQDQLARKFRDMRLTIKFVLIQKGITSFVTPSLGICLCMIIKPLRIQCEYAYTFATVVVVSHAQPFLRHTPAMLRPVVARNYCRGSKCLYKCELFLHEWMTFGKLFSVAVSNMQCWVFT